MKARNKAARWAAFLLLLPILLQTVLPALAQAGPGAEEEKETVYLRTAGDLLELARSCTLDTWSRNRTVVLLEDISLEGEDFLPIPDDGQPTHRIRYLPPDGRTDHLVVYVKEDGGWVKAEHETAGSYLVFTVTGNQAEIAVVSTLSVWWMWLLALILVLLVILVIVKLIRKLRRWKGGRRQAAAVAAGAPALPGQTPPGEEQEKEHT